MVNTNHSNTKRGIHYIDRYDKRYQRWAILREKAITNPTTYNVNNAERAYSILFHHPNSPFYPTR